MIFISLPIIIVSNKTYLKGRKTMKAIGETITNYRKAAGLSLAGLAEELEKHNISISTSSLCCWEKNTTTPNANQFLTLCKILGITDVYGEFIGKLPSDNPFAGLNQKGIERVKEYINLLLLSDEFKDIPENVIPLERYLPKFTLPVSAGLGEFLDGDDYESIVAGEDVPSHADFALEISGDSMEPRFHDQQIVWVERTEELGNGEIGIFCLNGESHIKKLQDNKERVFLISLNRSYKPIPVQPDDSFKILGRVLQG